MGIIIFVVHFEMFQVYCNTWCHRSSLHHIPSLHTKNTQNGVSYLQTIQRVKRPRNEVIKLDTYPSTSYKHQSETQRLHPHQHQHTAVRLFVTKLILLAPMVLFQDLWSMMAIDRPIPSIQSRKAFEWTRDTSNGGRCPMNHEIGVGDTISDSIQCLSFAEKWYNSIFVSILHPQNQFK